VPVQLRIGPKLMLALAGLLAATVMVSGVAVAGLGAVDARAQELYRHNILTTQAIAELQATLDDAAQGERPQPGRAVHLPRQGSGRAALEHRLEGEVDLAVAVVGLGVPLVALGVGNMLVGLVVHEGRHRLGHAGVDA